MKNKATKNTRYLSTCKKWGGYNPVTYVNSSDGKHKIDIGRGTNIPLHRSDLDEIKIDTSKYRTATLKTYSIIVGRNIYKEYCLIKKGVTYHVAQKKYLAADYKLLLDKVAKREVAKKAAKIEKAEKGKMITAGQLANQFGWCDSGIEDFCEVLGISKRERAKDIINTWKKADKYTRESLKSSYAEEIAELLNYCRNA